MVKKHARKAKSVEKKEEQLFRSKKDRIIAGVCGGLGDYFKMDPVWFRIGFALLFFANGVGLLAYILMWIIVPENPRQRGKGKHDEQVRKIERAADQMVADAGKKDGKVWFGIIVLLIGAMLLFNNLFHWWSFHMLWPLLLVLFGIYLLSRRERR